MTFEAALGLVRMMIDQGITREAAVGNPAIPADLRDQISSALDRDAAIVLVPVQVIVANQGREQWLRQIDRSSWYYWPRLREYLLAVKHWNLPAARSLDEASDRVLGQLSPPDAEEFDIRGLVLGYVQSGKTANFTALIAKAADIGYRLIVVLSGIDNGLRRQTQIRLKKELVGYSDNRTGAVRLPPLGRQWHEFTRDDLNGDFQPGFANHAALQGSQPVLLVVKKNGPVLRRLLRWLDSSPEEVRRSIPLLVVDDEADQASVDTRGTYQEEGEPLPDDYEAPSVINGLIRDLLRRFRKRAYVAYTATPFANILIPHDTFDPARANDLHPKDFIVDLPKPEGYFGAEELFGRFDPATGGQTDGLDVVRDLSDTDLQQIQNGELSDSLELALLDFVLGGAARAERGQSEAPATMLIHVSHLIDEQRRVAALVEPRFSELRDDWRYQRNHGIRNRLETRWDQEFRPVIRASHLDRDRTFSQIEPFITPFFESVQVRTINSATGDVLDYDRDPGLKAIAVGGNRLSRGLTLEGLLVSFFVRNTVMYDTLMQMGRWFGFRNGYEDLTRIYTTPQLSGWFSDLAYVEHRLREDLRVYEEQGLTPREVGTRIWQHPTMQVTSPLKRRFASSITISQSYSLTLEQTFKFPLRRPDDLAVLCERNVLSVRGFLSSLPEPVWSDKGPYWTGRTAAEVLDFLQNFRVDAESRSISLELIRSYIERRNDAGELATWTVAVRGRETRDTALGNADWQVPGGTIHQISRTRIRDTDSLGVITSPGDEAVGLNADSQQRTAEIMARGIGENPAARQARPAGEGLLLLYPISRFSGQDASATSVRQPIYDNPNGPQARDLIGLAISFPKSDQPGASVEAYMQGTVAWRAVE